MTEPPEVVERFAAALAEWLASFTVPAELAAEMADACADGPPWVAAIAGMSVRRAGWPDQEALAWGISVGALAGAIEAARASLVGEAGAEATAAAQSSARAAAHATPRTADGPARALLAADGLVAAAHEALSGLAPVRSRAALDALAGAFGNGGPWRDLPSGPACPAWTALVPCALAPAAAESPTGPWADYGLAWRRAFGRGAENPAEAMGGPSDHTDRDPLWHHQAADPTTRRLLRAAAGKARFPTRAGTT
ncbi:MAG TPA: hypothetical protein VM737_00760 [Gemmatimonadota bacterium]|nr:hypothetical protein [Gemmatimonadota bacterium]